LWEGSVAFRTKITNEGGGVVPLPPPYNGILAPGESAIVGESVPVATARFQTMDGTRSAVRFYELLPTVLLTPHAGEASWPDPVAEFAPANKNYVDDLMSGGGLGSHKLLRQLIHLADGVGGPMDGWPTNAFREILPAADPFPTSVTWWNSPAKTAKIVEKLITYTGVFPTIIQWKAYASNGVTVLATVTDTIVYSGPFEVSRTRAIA
jgi:hypothetical protein